ncbi:MAG: hypothetical protein KF723_22795 [Rhizobiaceae bacterium]|nr:hypothetical protein [Rhizobiaceae bacterium]
MTDQLKITQPIIVRVIDVPNITFNSWRTRNNLFPHTKLNAKRKTFSWDELCVAIVVARMIKMGMAAQRAVDIGMALLPAFKSGAKPIAVIRSAEDIEYRNNAEVEVLAEPAIVFDMTDLRAWAVLRLVELYPEIMSHPEFYGVQPANRTKTKRRPSRKVQT